MNTRSTTQPASRKLLMHMFFSMLILAIGIALLIYMVTVEDEPGALPLGLIVLGIGWFFIARARLRPRPH